MKNTLLKIKKLQFIYIFHFVSLTHHALGCDLCIFGQDELLVMVLTVQCPFLLAIVVQSATFKDITLIWFNFFKFTYFEFTCIIVENQFQ